MVIKSNLYSVPLPKRTPISAALELASRGFAVFPLVENKKFPIVATGFKAATKDPVEINRWISTYPNANVGVATGPASNIWVLDIDVKDGAQGFQSLAALEQEFGKLPETLTCETGSGGLHLFFSYPETGKIGNRAAIRPGIDVRGDGGYCVATPSIVFGNAYKWIDSDAPIAQAPDYLVQLVRRHDTKSTTSSSVAANEPIAQGSRNDKLMRLAVQQMKKGHARDKVEELVLDANETLCDSPLPVGEAKQIVDNVFRLYENQVVAHFTDMGNAQRMASQFGNDVRFVVDAGQWLQWNGIYWEVVHKLAIDALAKEIPSGMHLEAEKMTEGDQKKALKRHATSTEAAPRLVNMVDLFKSEAGIAIKASTLDRHNFLLPVENGVINLKTGTFEKSTRDLLITQVANVNYDPEATCPQFEAFLMQIMNNDKECVNYLQKSIGYTLTGETTEQCLFFAYGYGANGKSTFFNIIRALSGDLGTQAAGETLLEQNRSSSGPSGDLARLRGKRFVALSEIDDGKHFAEGLIKSLTGGDAITARYLYKDIFEFVPTHKLWLAANHQPIIKGNGHGIWRRIRLIPFAVTFKKEDQDPQLEKKLRAELPGILNWAIKGCMDWQKHGLVTPEKIRKATEEYRANMDVLGAWLAEFCAEGSQYRVKFDDAFRSYAPWLKDNYSWETSKNRFGRQLKERGFEPRKTPQRYYHGFALREHLSLAERTKHDNLVAEEEENSGIFSYEKSANSDSKLVKNKSFDKLILAFCGLKDWPDEEREDPQP